ncbi:MAG TPA: hypothetical protein VE861_07750 [Gemmatimonadaceae bacterium]|nr:hypothetical protein [Gemmatimonadaceae bacterium]
MMRTIYTTGTIDLGKGPIPPDSMVEIENDEAERLIALGVAIDPDQRIVVEAADLSIGGDVSALVAERDALLVTVAEAREANEEFNAQHAEMKAALEASHAEIDRLTKALAAAEKKK